MMRGGQEERMTHLKQRVGKEEGGRREQAQRERERERGGGGYTGIRKIIKIKVCTPHELRLQSLNTQHSRHA